MKICLIILNKICPSASQGISNVKLLFYNSLYQNSYLILFVTKEHDVQLDASSKQVASGISVSWASPFYPSSHQGCVVEKVHSIGLCNRFSCQYHAFLGAIVFIWRISCTAISEAPHSHQRSDMFSYVSNFDTLWVRLRRATMMIPRLPLTTYHRL
jgi:hypothetical protein